MAKKANSSPSRYFKQAEWFASEEQFCVRLGNETFPAKDLLDRVKDRLRILVPDFELLIVFDDVENSYNVKYTEDKFLECCHYTMSEVFAQNWLDFFIDACANALYSRVKDGGKTFGDPKTAIVTAEREADNFAKQFS